MVSAKSAYMPLVDSVELHIHMIPELLQCFHFNDIWLCLQTAVWVGDSEEYFNCHPIWYEAYCRHIRIRYTYLSFSFDNLPNEIEMCSDEFQVCISFFLDFSTNGTVRAWMGTEDCGVREGERFEIVNNLLPVMWWTFFPHEMHKNPTQIPFYLSTSSFFSLCEYVANKMLRCYSSCHFECFDWTFDRTKRCVNFRRKNKLDDFV